VIGGWVGQKLSALVKVVVSFPQCRIEEVFATATHIPPKPVLAFIQFQLILLDFDF